LTVEPLKTNENPRRGSSHLLPIHAIAEVNIMNAPLRLFIRSRPSWQSITTHHYSTTPTLTAMKPGTKIPGLDALYPPHDPKKGGTPDPEKIAPVAKPREEYPTWVSGLVNTPPTLARLRKINFEEATIEENDYEMKRYLKLVRRGKIKEDNMVAGSS
jgi:hypothetical protein